MDLKSLLQNGPVLAPGCYDPFSGLLIQRAGFHAAYLSGASLSYTLLGLPDVGLVSFSELADAVGRICERIDIPLIVDADTGFGNALNVSRTVRLLEGRGASALQLEDQASPKRCGHLRGKTLVATEEMVGKLRAALDARTSAQTLIIARTDAVANEGIGAALERMLAYAEAGADVLFVEAVESLDQMKSVAKALNGRGLLMANMIEGGVTPIIPLDRLGEMGFRLVIYPGAFVRVVLTAATDFLSSLKTEGSSLAFSHRMSNLADVNHVLGAERLLAEAQRYDAGIVASALRPAAAAGG